MYDDDYDNDDGDDECGNDDDYDLECDDDDDIDRVDILYAMLLLLDCAERHGFVRQWYCQTVCQVLVHVLDTQVLVLVLKKPGTYIIPCLMETDARICQL